MLDGILSIGAVFEKAPLEGDFTEASEMVKSAMEGWSMAFESSKKATRDAALAMRESDAHGDSRLSRWGFVVSHPFSR